LSLSVGAVLALSLSSPPELEFEADVEAESEMFDELALRLPSFPGRFREVEDESFSSKPMKILERASWYAASLSDMVGRFPLLLELRWDRDEPASEGSTSESGPSEECTD
jgi:hypothetical protein